MNRLMNRLWQLLLLIVIYLNSSNCFARAKTNVNEVTDLFDRQIESKGQLFKDMEQQNQNSVKQIQAKQAYELVPAMDKADSKALELNSIKATDLDDEGRRKRASKEHSFYDENELEPDYTKAGNRMHKLDAKEIAIATGKLVGDLMSRLKEFGVDCKTVKGPVQKEPIYHIELKREDQTNTEYDQFFCEETRNQYNCTRTVSVKCAQTIPGAKMPQTIRIPFSEVRRWWAGMVFACNDLGVMEGLRQLITSKTGKTDIEVPHQQVLILGAQLVYYQIDPNGNYGNIQGTWHETEERYNGSIRFFYRVPQGAICTRWEENFNETCRLK